jgi:hypothetical protein
MPNFSPRRENVSYAKTFAKLFVKILETTVGK